VPPFFHHLISGKKANNPTDKPKKVRNAIDPAFQAYADGAMSVHRDKKRALRQIQISTLSYVDEVHEK
jgi:hypothetical protein